MSERQIDVDLSTGTETRIDQVPIPEESEVLKFRSKIAQVLDRSLTVDRLGVNLPKGLKGGWCSNDPLSIAQWELRGYKVDTEFATRNGLNDSSDGRARIADVIHMVRPEWMEQEEKKVMAVRYRENHLVDRQLNKVQKEEREFLAQNTLPPIVNSNSENVSGDVIEESLKKQD